MYALSLIWSQSQIIVLCVHYVLFSAEIVNYVFCIEAGAWRAWCIFYVFVFYVIAFTNYQSYCGLLSEHCRCLAVQFYGLSVVLWTNWDIVSASRCWWCMYFLFANKKRRHINNTVHGLDRKARGTLTTAPIKRKMNTVIKTYNETNCF